MSTPNDDALPTNERINKLMRQNEAFSLHINRLVAENTAQRDLLRQAVEALEKARIVGGQSEVDAAIAAINEHLKEQP